MEGGGEETTVANADADTADSVADADADDADADVVGKK